MEKRITSNTPKWYTRGYLPHLNQPGIIQHITYRLADSLPSEMFRKMRREAAASTDDHAKRQTELRRKIEAWLDAGHGSCALQIPKVAQCIVDTWINFDRVRYHLLSWVVMPNHCHVMIEPFDGFPVGKIVLSWKNYTARFINKTLDRAPGSRSKSPVWQREFWDRFIRDQAHFEATRRYIEMNPVKAGLVAMPEEWPWSSAGKDIGMEGRD